MIKDFVLAMVKDSTTVYLKIANQNAYLLDCIISMNSYSSTTYIKTTFHSTCVLHLKENMISDKKLQGRFHLLAILLIPANMMVIFLDTTWWLELTVHVLSVMLIIFSLKKKTE